MTRAVSTVDVSSFTTDAKFRTWGAAVKALLAAGGLVQTADTGQIDWTTVTKPIAVTTTAGYEIWRFNDTLQSTTPIFIKISYGSQSVASGNGPGFTGVMVGTGSNGTGTITGLQTTVGTSPGYGIVGTNGPTNTAHTMISTHTSGFWMFHGDGLASAGGVTAANNQSGLFFIDRKRSQTDGSPVDGGWTFGWMSYNATLASGYLQTWTVNTLTGYNDGAFVNEGVSPPSNTASGWGNRLFPFYTSTPTPSQGVGVIGVGRGDIAQKATFTCYPIGTSIRRTYINLCSADTTYRMGANADAVNNCGLALLWED